MVEVRFHGRGGQGAVTAAELLAVAVAEQNKNSQSFPVFGVERRGAPVTSYCRISDKPIRVHQPITNPDVVVVLDATLMDSVNIFEGVPNGGKIIINSKKPKSGLKLEDGFDVYVVDATTIALEIIGKPIVNTALLGAFSKVMGDVVSLDNIKKAIEGRFKDELLNNNLLAIDKCYKNLN